MEENNDWQQVAVEEEETTRKDWVVTVKDKLQQGMDTIKTTEKQQWEKRSINKVPKSVRDRNENAYKPQYVSFGPYHHGKDELKQMEEHKERALLRFLKRYPDKPLESHFESLAEVAQSLKDSYESLDLDWQRDTGTGKSFLQMMIVDGCFMIEVLQNFTESSVSNEYYTDKDPIFSNHGKLHVMPYIKRDMLMLENQLPMLLLTTLLDDEIKKNDEFLNQLILKFFFGDTRFSTPPIMGKCLHLLELYRNILFWQDSSCRAAKSSSRQSWCRRLLLSRRKKSTTTEEDYEIIRSALEITEAGISFKKNKSQSLDNISLDGGELCLPTIVVDDTTESMFLNLIAFERFHVGVGGKNAVTSYLFFMDSIIDTAKDVSLLRDEGIIQNALGSDKAVSNLFNSISKDTAIDPDSNLHDVHMAVEYYCKQRWNRWRANLKHTYFRNPWAIISVFAAFVLFLLTMLQTVYTLLSYYVPK